MNRALALLAALAACVALAACGSSSSSTKEVSKKQLITQADKACKAAVKSVSNIKEPKSKKDTAPYKKLDSAIGSLQKKLKGLKAKDSKVQKDYSAFLAAVDQQKKVSAKAASDGETPAVRKLSSSGAKKSAEGKAAANRIGFKVCGQS